MGCDMVDDSLITAGQYSEIETLKNDPAYQVHIIPGSDWEILAFGIQPSSYDDGYYPYGSDRPDILSDAAVRSAIRQCMDIDLINSQSGLTGITVPFAYFPFAVDHNSNNPVYGYDPLAGAAALDAVGWKDAGGNTATPRRAYSVPNVPDGTELVLDLYTSQNSLRLQTAESIKNSLLNCGVQVNIISLPAEELYASGGDGVLFGRNFDLALLSWNTSDTLPCQLFESEEIPTEENFWIGTDDGGGNITGYQNAAYDLYCRQARFGSSGAEQALQNHIEAGKILDQDVPVIGLSFNAKIFVSTGTLRLPDVYASEKYPYSSIEFWEFCDTCN
jgi:peptide/nickel transport system substrate-binding protein